MTDAICPNGHPNEPEAAFCGICGAANAPPIIRRPVAERVDRLNQRLSRWQNTPTRVPESNDKLMPATPMAAKAVLWFGIATILRMALDSIFGIEIESDPDDVFHLTILVSLALVVAFYYSYRAVFRILRRFDAWDPQREVVGTPISN